MEPHRPRPIPASIVLPWALLCLALAFAGCHEPASDPSPGMGNGDGNGDGTQMGFLDHDALGPVLTDREGNVLYIFTNDDPGASRCYGQCAQAWPPYTVEAVPEASEDIGPEITLVQRDDGTRQVAYKGRPLYRFAGDSGPGDASGDGRNGIWFVVRPPAADPDGFNGEGESDATTEDVTYHGDSMGFLAMPEGEAATTGVVMIHEWWGLNENIREMARLLATHGYAVLAVDLFNGSVASDAQEARAQVQGLDQEAANDNMAAAARLLRERGVERVASLGWCFGGGQSLQLALNGEDLAASVIYYGNLVTDEGQLDVIDHPVLGIFGEADGSIPVERVRQFETALGNLSIENDIYIYPDVGHAFANPSGDNWGADEAQDAWKRTLMFLRAHAPPGDA